MSQSALCLKYREMLDREPPTKAENVEFLRLAYEGTEDEKWDLVKRNARIVLWVIGRYFNDYMSNDTFSDGLWGFYTAVTRLKEGATPQEFFGYSHKYIRGYVQQGVIQRNSQLSRFRYVGVREMSLDEYDGSSDDRSRLEVENPIDLSPADVLSEQDTRAYSKAFIDRVCEDPGMRLTDVQKERFALLARHGGNLSSAAREAGVSAEWMRVIKRLVEERMFAVVDSRKELERELTDNYGVPNLYQYRRDTEVVETYASVTPFATEEAEELMVAGVA